ncbi:MAG: M15 family metallopeptidase [Prochlorococcaceae cyanobacterium]
MEKQYKGFSGYMFLFLELVVLAAVIFGFMRGMYIPSALLVVVFVMIAIGFTVVDPNQSCVMVLFGAYSGTIKSNGFYWVNPFFVRKKISLRARNFDSETIKVNDKLGNPIMIGLVLVWRVQETYKAAFGVDEFEHFVVVQSEAALRKLAGLYPYDNIEDESAKVTLRDGTEEVNNELEREIIERLDIAGIEVIEARINHIAYAQEIGWGLAIFDAWRPLEVQAFMLERAFEAECRRRGLDPHSSGANSPGPQSPDPFQDVRELVARFWAAPSADPAMPPPHSTGAAVDLTLADAEGSVLAMGGEIDALGPESEPDYYAFNGASNAASDGALDGASWQQRRQLLRLVMEQAGFVQHPNEWWHFSFGDQLWAWRRCEPAALYGRVMG